MGCLFAAQQLFKRPGELLMWVFELAAFGV